jgi:putative FmdB family regulatory protein
VPLYEYRCAKCGKVFEVLQKFADAPLKRHKDCGGSVTRLISTSSFQLKGGGWYSEGYAKAPPKAEGKSDGDGKPSGESKTETKSESKTEGKSESKSESKPAKSDKPAKAKK